MRSLCSSCPSGNASSDQTSGFAEAGLFWHLQKPMTLLQFGLPCIGEILTSFRIRDVRTVSYAPKNSRKVGVRPRVSRAREARDNHLSINARSIYPNDISAPKGLATRMTPLEARCEACCLDQIQS